MARRARKEIVGKREDIERRRREREHAVLRRTLHAEWRNRPEDQLLFGYEPDDLDDEWDQRADEQ